MGRSLIVNWLRLQQRLHPAYPFAASPLVFHGGGSVETCHLRRALPPDGIARCSSRPGPFHKLPRPRLRVSLLLSLHLTASHAESSLRFRKPAPQCQRAAAYYFPLSHRGSL